MGRAGGSRGGGGGRRRGGGRRSGGREGRYAEAHGGRRPGAFRVGGVGDRRGDGRARHPGSPRFRHQGRHCRTVRAPSRKLWPIVAGYAYGAHGSGASVHCTGRCGGRADGGRRSTGTTACWRPPRTATDTAAAGRRAPPHAHGGAARARRGLSRGAVSRSRGRVGRPAATSGSPPARPCQAYPARPAAVVGAGGGCRRDARAGARDSPPASLVITWQAMPNAAPCGDAPVGGGCVWVGWVVLALYANHDPDAAGHARGAGAAAASLLARQTRRACRGEGGLRGRPRGVPTAHDRRTARRARAESWGGRAAAVTRTAITVGGSGGRVGRRGGAAPSPHSPRRSARQPPPPPANSPPDSLGRHRGRRRA